MYLKSLQAVGFKSFADRTIVNFDRGVTAIVGPNGCGKSNVLDAIRWVLGEQSAKALRGGSMQDVIFSGTDKRKAMGMAEISLTFGDCEGTLGTEYNEVTLTRRVFRDGQSEYELNKTPCRLRDIHQMFMDTGIGRTAYSIMEQGKIDKILSSRPEDRRAIFEEAAGITKYKSQKKEAMRKLEHTDANLLRLTDIIREVERQIRSLQRQAGKAKRYQERLDELKDLETKLARHQFDIASVEITGLQEAVDGAREEQNRLRLELEGKEIELTDAREQLDALDVTLRSLRERQSEVRNGQERAAQQRSTNEGRVTEFTDLAERARLELAGTGEKIKAQEEQLANLNDTLARSESEREATAAACREHQEEVTHLNARINSTEAERAEHEETIEKLTEAINKVRGELAALEVQQKNFLFRVEQLKEERTQTETKLAEARTAAEASTAAIGEAELTLNARKAELTARREEESEAAQARKDAIAAHNTASGELRTLQARKEALDQLEASHAGAPEGAQEILQAAVAGDRLRGSLSDHFQAKPGYEAPIALLLGDAVNTLIVQNRSGAEEILAHLRSGDTAKACNFLALDMPRPAALAGNDTTSAMQFVEPDEFARPLLAALLADAHIVDDLLGAYALKTLKPEATVATQAGELVTRAGVVCVGRSEGGLGVLTRQNEIRELAAKIEPAEAELNRLAEALDGAEANVQTVREGVAAAGDEVKAAEIALAECRQEDKTRTRAVGELERELANAIRETDKLAAQDQTDHERVAQLREKVSGHEATIAEARENAERLTAILNELATQDTELSERLTEAKVRLATQQQQCEGWQQQREPVANRLMELRELLEVRTREMGEHEQRIEEARAAITQAEESQTRLATEAEEIAGTLGTEQEKRNVLATDIDQREAAMKGNRDALAELQSSQSGREVKLEKHKMQLGNLRDRIRSSYHLELEDLPALTEEDAELDWPSIENQVTERRAQLDAMGPVNLDAIQEYAELEERYTFLQQQDEDMRNAKEDLLKTIAHINQTTKKLFAETFEQIKENFQEMFTALFGGGKATLVLLDAENPLDCGIDVVAKPPGKQLQSITLLSGGEKTMTAVSLLFAIYMVKPSPFCVLDEMDAPLDDSNISRFIKMLDRFVSQSQFVVITHNKRTISRADALYGVTMEEHGVSKLVSVRLSKGRGNGDAKGDVMSQSSAATDPNAPSPNAKRPGDDEQPSGQDGNEPAAVGARHEPSLPHEPGFEEDPDGPSIAESFGKSGDLS